MTDIETADALHLAGDIDAAAHLYRRLLAADPGNVAAWHGLGAARLQGGAYGEASDALLRAVRLRPDEAAAWGLLAEALFWLGDVERAIYAYRRAATAASMRTKAEENVAVIIPGSAAAGNADVFSARYAWGSTSPRASARCNVHRAHRRMGNCGSAMCRPSSTSRIG